MSDAFRNDPKFLALYHLPVTAIELSESAINRLGKSSIVTVGDCVDVFIVWQSGAMVSAPFELVEIMINEVAEKLKEFGYWGFVEKATAEE